MNDGLTIGQKIELMKLTTEIVKEACARESGYVGADDAPKVLEAIYNKMVELVDTEVKK